MKRKKLKYNCLKCTGYCCSYDRIEVSEKDIRRLAQYFEISQQDVKSKHLKTYKLKNKKGYDQVVRPRSSDLFREFEINKEIYYL